jgi:hypothetical protein
MQKIRIIGIFKNRLHWYYEVKKNLQKTVLRYIYLRYIFIYVQGKTLLHEFLIYFDKWGKN